MMVRMDYSSGGWIVFQAAAGGVVAGVAAVLHVWWYLTRRDRFILWITVWLAPFAVLFLLNSSIAFVESGTPADTALLWLRSQALAATILLAMPAVASITGGPRPFWWVAAAGGFFAVRAVLFLTTNLVYAHEYVGGMPQYGPLLSWTFAIPVAITIWYVVLCIRALPVSAMRTVAVAASLASFSILLLAFILISGELAELLTSLWALPVIGMVIYAGLRHTRDGLTRSVRQQHMRDALASLTNAAWFDRQPEHLLSRAEASARALLDNPAIEGRITRMQRGGYYTSFSVPPEYAKDEQVRSFLDDMGYVISAAADRHELSRRLREAAHTDSLTGLVNRRRLDEIVDEEWQREDVARMAVLFCDIDAFKQVNDEFGHPTGDTVLQSTARALREVVGQRGVVGRYGGDEFVVVLPEVDDDDAVVDLAHDLQHAVVSASPGKVRSVSVGVVIADRSELREPYSLVRDADSAMFEAKHKRIGVFVFDEGLRDRVIGEIALGRRLARAFAAGELEVRYQPVVDPNSLEVVALEALSHWPDANGGHEPAAWVPVAEESGLIIEIGLGAVRAARWASDRYDLPVGVNVSPRQLAEEDLAHQILAAWGADRRDRLVVEITESALLDDLSLGIQILQTLRAEGVQVAIDDFGTGYSTLARLGNLPVDVLKVDRELVEDILTERGRAVVRGVLQIAHAHGLRVVVEGIETRDQLAAAIALGADMVQGYLVGRPTSEAPQPVRLPPR